MTFLDIWRFVTIIVGPLLWAATVPQIYKIWKNKSSKDVSLATTVFYLFGVSVWLVYGFLISDFPLIIGNAVGVVMLTLLVLAWFKFRYGENNAK